MDLEKLLRDRYKEELKRLNLSGAEAARRLNEKNGDRMKSMLGGRIRIPADVLANSVLLLDMDGSYVLTGQRSISVDIVRKLMTRANDLDEMLPDENITAEMKVDIVCSVLKTSQHLGPEVDQQAFIAALHAVTGE